MLPDDIDLRQILFILPLILLLPFIAILPVYIYLGYKLNESRLRLAIMGFGVLFFLPLICLPFLCFDKYFKPAFMLAFWSVIQVLSPVFALLLAGFIAYKKGILKKTIA